jgi:DNA-directed RNA polymerase specialized sigma24 family protein
MKLTEAQEQEIIRRYVAGASPKALAYSFGVTRQTIHNIINRAGVKRVRIYPGDGKAGE